jgi:hypothetical protein
MNKLKIPNGGMPLHGDDFEWLQAASKDAIKGMVHAFAVPFSGNMILSGCEVAGSAVAPGYVLIDYEVCYYPGGTLPTSINDGPKFVLSVTYDAAGADVFADSVTRDTYEVRRAVVVDNFTGIDVSSGPRLDQRIWVMVESFNTNALVTQFHNGWSATGQMFVQLIGGGMKCLYGQLSTGAKSDTAATKILTIPAEYRPQGAERHLPFSFFDGSVRHALLIFKQNGDVEYIAGDADPVSVVVRVCVVYR